MANVSGLSGARTGQGNGGREYANRRMAVGAGRVSCKAAYEAAMASGRLVGPVGAGAEQ